MLLDLVDRSQALTKMSRPLIPRPFFGDAEPLQVSSASKPRKISNACGACKLRKTKVGVCLLLLDYLCLLTIFESVQEHHLVKHAPLVEAIVYTIKPQISGGKLLINGIFKTW